MTSCLKICLLKMGTKLGTGSLPCSEGVLEVNHISFLIWALDGRERGSLLRLWCAARDTVSVHVIAKRKMPASAGN
jgi:hypothetical protein